MKMNSEEPALTLAEIEAEVMAEGREWTRRRLAARLEKLAQQTGEVFPPQPAAADPPAPV